MVHGRHLIRHGSQPRLSLEFQPWLPISSRVQHRRLLQAAAFHQLFAASVAAWLSASGRMRVGKRKAVFGRSAL
jgi:hypothetical protein